MRALICCLLPVSVCFSQGTREKRIQPVEETQKQGFERQVKVALLVGIGAYPQGSGLSALKYPPQDVALLGDELTRQGYLVRRIVDSEASRGVVRRALNELADALEPGQGTFVFYYSGHGFAQDGVNYLATFGATVDDLRSEGLPVSEVESLLAKSKARQRVLWLDACRNDPNSMTRSATQRGFAELNASEGLRVLFSTRAGRVSYENDELHQGLFTHFLVRGLRGEAAGADGLVTFRDLADYVVDGVRAYGVQHGQVQVPYEAGESSGDFLMGRRSEASRPGGTSLPSAASPPATSPSLAPTSTSVPTLKRRSADPPIADLGKAPGLRIQAVHWHVTFGNSGADSGVFSVTADGIEFRGAIHQYNWRAAEIQEVTKGLGGQGVSIKLDKQSYRFFGNCQPGLKCDKHDDTDYSSLVTDILKALGRQ